MPEKHEQCRTGSAAAGLVLWWPRLENGSGNRQTAPGVTQSVFLWWYCCNLLLPSVINLHRSKFVNTGSTFIPEDFHFSVWFCCRVVENCKTASSSYLSIRGRDWNDDSGGRKACKSFIINLATGLWHQLNHVPPVATAWLTLAGVFLC